MAKIFISYSRKDKEWVDLLLPFLNGVMLDHEPWSDERIEAGQDWRTEIEDALQNATAAILLISQDFLTSPFIMNNELVALLRRREIEGIRIFPLIVRHSTWRAHPSIARMQPRPRDGEPLDGRRRPRREKELAAFASELAEIFARGAAERETAAHLGDLEERPQPARPRVVDFARLARQPIAINLLEPQHAAFKRTLEGGDAIRERLGRTGSGDDPRSSGSFGAAARSIE